MFIINGSKTEFTQWEQGITLKNTNMAKGDAVQFYSASGESAIMYAKEENGTVVVEVPNRMLQFAANITARLVKGGGVTSFAVKFVSYKQPEGYNFIDNEQREKAGGGGTADAVDWSNVQNKPFETVGGDTLTWDGNTSGLESFQIDDFSYYKITDIVPSVEELSKGGACTSYMMGDSLESEFTSAQENEDGSLSILNMDGAEDVNIAIKSDGIYFLYISMDEMTGYTSTLTINGYTGFTKETIKQEVLPEPVLTSPSGKKFKITVADNGTLGTTEV